MLSPKSPLLPPIFGLVIALMGADARAGFETFTASTGGMRATNYTTTLSIPAFDASKGSLESIVLSTSDGAQMSASLTNNSALTATFTISNVVDFGVSFLGASVLTDELMASKNYSIASKAKATFGTYNLTGGSGPSTIIDPTLLAGYVGTSPLSFDFSANAHSSTGGFGGNLFFNPTTMSDAVLTVTYNFIGPTIVPEPASVALSALGGLLVAAAGCARSRSRSRVVPAC